MLGFNYFKQIYIAELKVAYINQGKKGVVIWKRRGGVDNAGRPGLRLLVTIAFMVITRYS